MRVGGIKELQSDLDHAKEVRRDPQSGRMVELKSVASLTNLPLISRVNIISN